MEQNLYLVHHGIKGQKWGVRRYQNKDGTLTSLGRAHYGHQLRKEASKARTLESQREFVKRSNEFMDKYGSTEYRKIANSGLQGIAAHLLQDYSSHSVSLMHETVNNWEYSQIPYNPKAKTLKERYPGLDGPNGNMKLYDHIIDKSVDWYFSRPVSQRAKAFYKKYNGEPISYYGQSREQRIKRKQELLGIVLKDLDLENNQENRNLIEDYVFWD